MDIEIDDISLQSETARINLELFRRDLLELRQKCGLSLADISELSGFSKDDIRAQEGKDAPSHIGIITSLSLIYCILILAENKGQAMERLRSYIGEN